MSKHSKFSASAAERWTVCTASVNASLIAPKIIDNKYSIAGTASHQCLETLLENHTGRKQIGEHLRESYSSAIVSHAESAARVILGQWVKYADSELLTETRTKLDHIHDDFGGTYDAGVVALFDRLIIFDYKYGTKIVKAERNLQLIIYALGEARKHDFNFADVELVIVQPRAPDIGSLYRSWTLPIEELEKYEDFFKSKIDEAESRKKAKFVAGSHCYWCPARLACPLKEKEKTTQAQNDFLE